MKTAGKILLALGFLGGAFLTVRTEREVEWPRYAPCAGAMLIGLVLVRVAASKERGDTEKHGESMLVLEKSLASLVGKLEAMNGDRDDIDVHDVHGRIDADLMDDLNSFVEAREALIPLYGLQRYADLMSAFAGSERMINRSWSASADGYIDEVWKSMGKAEGLMRHARDLLQHYKEAA